MTNAQKIIKYIATAFAIFLIVTIISAILTGGYALLNGLGLINTNNAVITEDLKTISSDIGEVSTLKIDLAYTNLYIKAGEKFEVQTNNNKITFENNNGSVKIKENSKYLLSSESMESNLVVYIPEDMMIIDETNIDAGAGKINIEKLNTKGLYLELGAGEVYIEKTIATDETSIDGGVGKTELKQCQLNNLKADLGVGEFKFSGTLTGKNEINSGIGATSLELTGKKEDYTIKASKGLGNITLDGQTIESDKDYGNGKNYLDIDGGVGEIKIDFRD